MIKLLIVDDEEKTRHGLKEIIDWESNGVIICGEATNGLEALEFISFHLPDILLTDIKMPVMDGLELIELVSSRFPHIKSIIMSGYDDFSYAQKAMKFGSADYILKPSKAEEILETVLKVKRAIELENSRKKMFEKLKLHFNESLPMLTEKYLSRLIHSENNDIADIKNKLQTFNVDISCNYSAVMMIRIDYDQLNSKTSNNEDFELMKFAVKNISEEILKKYFNLEIFENNDNIIAILKLDQPSDSFEDFNNKSCFKELVDNIKSFLDLSISIGIGRCYQGIHSINSSYHDALKALEITAFQGEGKIVFYKDIIEQDLSETAFPLSLEKELLNCIRNGNIDELSNCFEKFFSSLQLESCSKGNILKSILALFFSLYHFCIENNIKTQDIFGQDFEVLDEMLRLNNFTQIKARLIDLYKMSCTIYSGKKNNNKLLKQAIKYIEENYSKELDRETIAERLYISPGYLSILFKQELGVNFLDYLHKIRIEKACQLLNDSNLKTYEVAFRTGYNDEKYFFQVFKKYTNMTPNQYRESH